MPGIMPLAFPAGNHIRIAFQEIEDGGNLRGVVLEVGVHGNDIPASGDVKPYGKGGRLAAIVAQAHSLEIGSARLALKPIETAVTAAVVDYDNLVIPRQAAAGLFNLRKELRQALLFVIGRYNDG